MSRESRGSNPFAKHSIQNSDENQNQVAPDHRANSQRPPTAPPEEGLAAGDIEGGTAKWGEEYKDSDDLRQQNENPQAASPGYIFLPPEIKTEYILLPPDSVAPPAKSTRPGASQEKENPQAVRTLPPSRQQNENPQAASPGYIFLPPEIKTEYILLPPDSVAPPAKSTRPGASQENENPQAVRTLPPSRQQNENPQAASPGYIFLPPEIKTEYILLPPESVAPPAKSTRPGASQENENPQAVRTLPPSSVAVRTKDNWPVRSLPPATVSPPAQSTRTKDNWPVRSLPPTTVAPPAQSTWPAQLPGASHSGALTSENRVKGKQPIEDEAAAVPCYQCRLCAATFSTYNELGGHMSLHPQEGKEEKLNRALTILQSKGRMFQSMLKKMGCPSQIQSLFAGMPTLRPSSLQSQFTAPKASQIQSQFAGTPTLRPVSLQSQLTAPEASQIQSQFAGTPTLRPSSLQSQHTAPEAQGQYHHTPNMGDPQGNSYVDLNFPSSSPVPVTQGESNPRSKRLNPRPAKKSRVNQEQPRPANVSGTFRGLAPPSQLQAAPSRNSQVDITVVEGEVIDLASSLSNTDIDTSSSSD